MMHSTMEQIAIWNGHAWSIFACSTELKVSMIVDFDQVWGTILPLYLLKDFRYQPEIWQDDA